MDLRHFPEGTLPADRCAMRRTRIEDASGVSLAAVGAESARMGDAEHKNCENMFGHVPLPVGVAGPLPVHFSSNETQNVLAPLATTEAALVASVHRGCKAIREAQGVRTFSTYHGISRSIAFAVDATEIQSFTSSLTSQKNEWVHAAEATSSHLRVLRYDVDHAEEYVFLTLHCDTDHAMGMNMVTIAAQAAAECIVERCGATRPRIITIAANIDSDKKPSRRTYERGRGYEIRAEAILSADVLQRVLHATPEDLCGVARAKLQIGSHLAGAIGHNLHAANMIAALYLATGQDAAHVVEGSLTDTDVEEVRTANDETGIRIALRLPALLIGVRGGGTALPAQHQCLQLLLGGTPDDTARAAALHPCARLAECMGAVVLAGELSLLAAQATNTLASSHKKLAR